MGEVITVRTSGRPDFTAYMPRQRSCALGDRPAADAGAGRDRIDPPRREELTPRSIQIRVVAVDVAQVDPGAHHVAELHASLVQQVFGKVEHAERLLVGRFARPAQPGGVEPDFIAEVDPHAMRTSALGTAAGGLGCDRFELRRRLFGRTACTETSRQARSFNGGCSISVVAGL